MKAFVRTEYGQPEVLRLEDVPTPTPGDCEVLVRLVATSINRADLDHLLGWPTITRLARGLRRPRNPRLGTDIAGVVEAAGPGISEFATGDRVFADLFAYDTGTFAELVTAPASAFALIPESLSFETAATLPHAAILALQGLGGGRPIEPGQHVLVNGASGNVGPFAVQLAKAYGAEVTGACSTAKLDFVRSIGADHVVDYTREDVIARGQRFDRVLDVETKRSIASWRRALKPGGRYVTLGGTSRRILEAMVVGGLASLGSDRTLGLAYWWRPFKKEDLATLVELVETGKLTPAIDRTYPFEEIPIALRYMLDGHARGKLVITA
jgi:NADPH:quinone reductase-like Zn-dependent oxidoreductase